MLSCSHLACFAPKLLTVSMWQTVLLPVPLPDSEGAI